MLWLPAFLTLLHAAADPDPVAVFAKLNGSWQGNFVGYSDDGRELYRIQVRQTYVTVDKFTQRVEIEDRMPDGTVITGRGRNTARRLGDGSLELRCVVEKSNGERVEHLGRVVKGADGEEQLVWYSKDRGKVETFREVVGEERGKPVYTIDGMGRYGGTLILMHGRYRRPSSSMTAPR